MHRLLICPPDATSPALWRHMQWVYWAIHLIPVPHLSRIHVFHSYTLEEFQTQNLLPLKNSKISSSKLFTPEEFHAQNPSPMTNSKLKTLYPWKIPSSKPFTLEEFQAQNPLPLKNSKLKTLYPWRIPGILDREGGGGGGGVRILNGIAHYK
jgi:hypothetical protein